MKAIVTDKELYCELHGVPIKTPSSAKYKISKYEKKAGPDLFVGKQAVLALSKGMDRVGLYLAVLVDWDDESGYWYNHTTLYFVVQQNSSEDMPDRLGRIVHTTWPSARFSSNISIASWNPDDFRKVGK